MRLKVSMSEKIEPPAPVTCVGWSSTEEVYSLSDDNQLLSWSVSTNLPTKLSKLNPDFFATDMQFLPKTNQTGGKHGEIILVTTADGKFHLMNRTGRLERTVQAHKGATLVGQWSNDGTSLLTGGEDGTIKIWSRSGMLRSTFVNSDSSIYAASWSPDSQSVAYSCGKCISVKHLAPNTKPLKWKAHDGLVLCLAWSSASDMIVSGGEDCKYRVWDSMGRPLFSSILHSQPITSIAWAPAGHVFAVASFNTVRLCDYYGWSRSLDKPQTGNIYKLCWSNDGTQLTGACASGQIFFAHIVERHAHYQDYSASVTERKVVTVKSFTDETLEELELNERVIQMALRYSKLVITTPSQCHIYHSSNWNTPFIFDLKDGGVVHLELAEKHMLLINKSSVNIYNYQGKLIGQPRWPNMRPESTRSSLISLSNDFLAIRDVIEAKNVHLVDLTSRSTTEALTTIQHSIPVTQIALDQLGPSSGRMLALLDKAHDFYVVQIVCSSKLFMKLGRKIDSFKWNATINVLAVIQDEQLYVWYCPLAAFDKKLLSYSSMHTDSAELGRNPRISDFVGSNVSIRRADGSLINVAVSPFVELLHKKILDNRWSEAIDLCRTVDSEAMWACFAVMALHSSLDVYEMAEEALSNINQFAKIIYLQYIKNLPSKAEQRSHLALLCGKLQEAETILLNSGQVYKAVNMHITQCNWSRALELAVKYKTHIDTVLYKREKYLEQWKMEESNKQFLSLRDTVEVDGGKIEKKIAMEQSRKSSQ